MKRMSWYVRPRSMATDHARSPHDSRRRRRQSVTPHRGRKGANELTLKVLRHRSSLWKAAWCFFDQGDRAAEAWVAVQAKRILASNSRQVAAVIRAKATRSRLMPDERKSVDICANYLTNK